MMIDCGDPTAVTIKFFIKRTSFISRIGMALKLIFGVYPDQEVLLPPNNVKELREALQNWEWENIEVKDEY